MTQWAAVYFLCSTPPSKGQKRTEILFIALSFLHIGIAKGSLFPLPDYRVQKTKPRDEVLDFGVFSQ